MEESRGSYLLGMIGALLGGILAMVPFVIVYHFNYIVFWLAFLFFYLASIGYDLTNGRQGYGKIPIVFFISLLTTVLAVFAEDTWYLLTDEGLAQYGLTLVDVPGVLWEIFQSDPEYRDALIYNLGLTLIVFFLNAVYSSIVLAKDISQKKRLSRQNQVTRMQAQGYGQANPAYGQGGLDNNKHGLGGQNSSAALRGGQEAGTIPQVPLQNKEPAQDSFYQPDTGDLLEASYPEENYYREEEASRPEE